MSQIRKYILDKVSSQELSNAEALQMLSELSNITKKNITPENDIAVIGISCKLPLGNNPADFWKSLENGKCGIDIWPTERTKDVVHLMETPLYSEFYLGKYVPLNFHDPSIYLKGGYLKEIDKFDADFFGIPPREARYMDPRHRMVLEAAWESIEDAGYGGDKIYNTKTGVFLGMENTNYTLYQYSTELDPMHLTGGWVSIQASRISYMYNMRGPCLVVDTACSSGLSALHVAIQSIKNNECEMALSGAVNLQLGAGMKENPGISDLSSVESKTEYIRTFDKDSDGTLWGEGLVFFLLKPLSKAIDDRDNIYAVVKSTAMNNDGASNGITAPNAEAQEEVVIKAWESAKINPESISYIETHGTGTVLGDPIEIKGLTQAFKKHTTKKQFCAIGSLKPSMGHLVATSGAASMLKVIMSMKNKKMAPTLHFNTPNPYINFTNSPLFVCDKLQEWKTQDFPRRGGVSSFGFSGTNVHAILEEFQPVTDKENLKPVYCVTISAKKYSLLQEYVAKYKKFVDNNSSWNLPDLAFTSNTGRGHYSHRLAILAKDEVDFLNKINILADAEKLVSMPESGIFYDTHKVISERKEKEEGDIYADDKNNFSKQVDNIITKISSTADYASSLCQMAELYVKGADVQFDKLYSDEKRFRISIPTYPLERIRFWADYKLPKHTSKTQGVNYGHPLIEQCLVESYNVNIYKTTLRVNDFWVLDDHRISGRATLPGTAYPEIAYSIGKDLFNSDLIELKDVLFLSPLFLDDDEEKEIQIIVEKQDDHYIFAAATQGLDGEWQKHAEGKIFKLNEVEGKKVDLDTIKNSFLYEHNLKELEIDAKTFTFGHHWNSLDVAYENTEEDTQAQTDKEVLLRQVLPSDIKSDIDEFNYHPGIMDNAANYLSQSFGNDVYLPLNYKSLKIYKKIPAVSYCHIKSKNIESGNLEVITFDWSIYNENGELLATATDYSLKKAPISQIVNQSLTKYYKYKWEKTELLNAPSALAGNFLVVGKNSEPSNRITDAYKAKGANVIRMQLSPDNVTEEQIEAFVKDISHTNIERIINIVTPENDIQSIDVLRQEEKLSLGCFLLLIKSILKHKIKISKGISVVAENANSVTENEKNINPLSSAAFGLAITIGKEYENLACGNIDIEVATSTDHIIAEIEHSASEVGTIAYRGNERFKSIFSRVDLEQKRGLTIQPSGVYLITGGAGGLGLEFARYLASQNNVKLALVNRSVFPERATWSETILNDPDSKLAESIRTIEAIEEMGSEVHLYSADVSDHLIMKDTLATVQNKLGKIAGVIHAAGVAGQGFIINKDESTFNSVLKPKVEGTWNILQNIVPSELDFVVLFSSMTTLLGIEGQSDYSAANSYLDGVGSAMKAKGVVTINWPGWSETGMAVDFNVSDNDEYILSKSISTADALEAFKAILQSEESNIMPGIISYPYLLKNINEIELSENLKKEVERFARRQTNTVNDTTTRDLNKEVLITGKREADLTPVEQVMAQVWGQVLGLNEIDIFDSFQELGGDSILGTHLLKAINAEYPNQIDISDIYSYPTVIQLSGLITSKIEPAIEKVVEGDEQNSDNELKSVLDKIGAGDLSIDSALSLLSDDDN